MLGEATRGVACASRPTNVTNSSRTRSLMSHLLSLSHSASKRKARLTRALRELGAKLLPAAGAAVCRQSEQRGREREQTDRKHDERAVHASDLAHRSLLSGFLSAPITLEPTPNRSITSG